MAGTLTGLNADWPNPAGPRSAVYHDGSRGSFSSLLTPGQDVFFASAGLGPAYDWSSPRGPAYPADLRTFVGPPLVLTFFGKDVLYGAAGQPLHNQDWPNPERGPRWIIEQRTHLDPLKLNLYQQDVFFGPIGMAPVYDWPNPTRRVDDVGARTYLQAYSLSIGYPAAPPVVPTPPAPPIIPVQGLVVAGDVLLFDVQGTDA